MHMGTGQGVGQPWTGPYAAGIRQHQPAGNGTFGDMRIGAPAGSGFDGMVIITPDRQSSAAGTTGKARVTRLSFTFIVALWIAGGLLSLTCFKFIIPSASHIDLKFEYDLAYSDGSMIKFFETTGAIIITYELVQVIFSCLEIFCAMTFMSTFAGTLTIFILDQVLAYLVFPAFSLLIPVILERNANFALVVISCATLAMLACISYCSVLLQVRLGWTSSGEWMSLREAIHHNR